MLLMFYRTRERRKMLSKSFPCFIVSMLALCATATSWSQTSAQAQTQVAQNDAPATADAKTTADPATSTKKELQPTVEQQLKAMQDRITQLENEVKAQRAAALADSNDTAALKAAEKEVVATSATPASSTSAAAGSSSSAAGLP